MLTDSEGGMLAMFKSYSNVSNTVTMPRNWWSKGSFGRDNLYVAGVFHWYRTNGEIVQLPYLQNNLEPCSYMRVRTIHTLFDH